MAPEPQRTLENCVLDVTHLGTEKAGLKIYFVTKDLAIATGSEQIIHIP